MSQLLCARSKPLGFAAKAGDVKTRLVARMRKSMDREKKRASRQWGKASQARPHLILSTSTKDEPAKDKLIKREKWNGMRKHSMLHLKGLSLSLEQSTYVCFVE